MTKMGKYIDRAALFNSLANAKTIGEVFAAIQDAPAEDVQEVRHGRWIETDTYPKCSVCGLYGVSDMNFCPNCGSRMDLEGDTE